MITLTVCQEFAGFYGGYRAMKTVRPLLSMIMSRLTLSVFRSHVGSHAACSNAVLHPDESGVYCAAILG